MLRMLGLGGIVVVFVSAFVLYSVSTETRRLAEKVDNQRRDKEALIKSISVLKAERAFRARPDAIAPLARKLGMRPLEGTQYIRFHALPAHQTGTRGRRDG